MYVHDTTNECVFIVSSLVALEYAPLCHGVAVLVVGEDGEAGEGGGEAEQGQDGPGHPQRQLGSPQGPQSEQPLHLGLRGICRYPFVNGHV